MTKLSDREAREGWADRYTPAEHSRALGRLLADVRALCADSPAAPGTVHRELVDAVRESVAGIDGDRLLGDWGGPTPAAAGELIRAELRGGRVTLPAEHRGHAFGPDGWLDAYGPGPLRLPALLPTWADGLRPVALGPVSIPRLSRELCEPPPDAA